MDWGRFTLWSPGMERRQCCCTWPVKKEPAAPPGDGPFKCLVAFTVVNRNRRTGSLDSSSCHRRSPPRRRRRYQCNAVGKRWACYDCWPLDDLDCLESQTFPVWLCSPQTRLRRFDKNQLLDECLAGSGIWIDALPVRNGCVFFWIVFG